MDFLFTLVRGARRGLRHQLRDQISAAICDGRIAPNSLMPSSRRLARKLGISRNTVAFAYSSLQDEGLLVSHERRGFYVIENVGDHKTALNKHEISAKAKFHLALDWTRRLLTHASDGRNIVKPLNWREFEFCFVYGQLDPALFPVRYWRECWRDAVGIHEIAGWTQDSFDRDDMMLVEQIRTNLLPRRGVWAKDSQILVTLGAQNALFIALNLLLNKKKCFGMEDPGYPDVRNIARCFTDNIRPLPIDDQGLLLGPSIGDCDVLYVTPSHQSPTTVTLTRERRQKLLELAIKYDLIVLEDDYEAEISFSESPLPALKSDDVDGRVIYIGSLSKTLAPGLRLGYLVGPEPFIREARALRRLMMRHPAANNQRAAAFFLSRGYHESLLRNLVTSNKRKWNLLSEALAEYLPDWTVAPSRGGSSFWVTGPARFDMRELAIRCMEEGVFIETGDVHYLAHSPPYNSFRLGYSVIPEDKIKAGVRLIAKIANSLF